jgi:asparagine synthase (glutamine-hydrolysing)
MPGVCAAVLSDSRPVGPLLEEMVGRMTHYAWHRPAKWDDEPGRVALGGVWLEPLAPQGVYEDAAAQAVVVFDGELYDGHPERARLEARGVVFAGSSHAELLLRGVRAEGDEFLRRLHGVFTALVWDGASRELSIITDRFGMRPAYFARTPAAFAAASEIKAVLAVPGVDSSASEDGVAQFFAFGYFFGESTFLSGVRALPPATRAMYRAADGTFRQHRYWTPRPAARTLSASDSIDALDQALVAAVGRRAHEGEHLGLSLSGGLDARTILGLMPPGLDLKTVSLGIEGSLDHRSSTKLAALAGVKHRNYVLDTAFLAHFEQHLRDMVRLTDGHYLDQGIVMTTMPVYRELGIEYLHRGHGGELLHMKKAYAFSLDEAVLGASEDALEAWLFSHLTDYMLGGVPDDLFTFDIRGRAREALRQALERTETAGRPVDRVWQLFVNERLHRETALSMHKFNCFATVRMPFIDNDVIDALAAIPAELKLDEALQAAILGRRRPEFLSVINANTGAKLGAGRLTREAAHFRMRVFAKLGVKGYQPYERLGLWLRRELRGLVESVLAGDRFLDQSAIRPDAVKRVVAQHLAGEANHTFLIMALLVYGMGREIREESQPAFRTPGA